MSATTDPLDRRTHFQKERKESYALLAVELPEEPESDSSSSSSSSSSLSVSACEAAKANAELEADVVGAAAPLAPTPASAATPTISSRGSITKLVHLDFEWESSLASEDGAKSPAKAAAAAGTLHFHTPTWGGSGNCNTRRSANRRRARIQRISNLSEITSSFNSDADFSDLGDDFGDDLVVVTEEDGDEKSGGADVYEVIIAKPQRNKEGGKTNNNDTFHKNYNLAPKSKSIRKNSSSSSSSSDRRMSATPAQIAMAIDALLMRDNNDEVHTGSWDDTGKDTRKSRASLASLESIENFARRNSILRKIPVAGSETGNVGDYGGNRDDYGNVETGEKDEEREVFHSLRVLLGNDAYLLDYDSSDDDDYNDNDETDERNTNDVNHPISTTSEEEELQKMIKLVNKSQRDSLSLARTKLYQHREQHRHEQQQHQLCRQNIQHSANCLEGNESENHHHRDDDISKADALVQTSFSSNKKLVATTVIDDDDCFDCDHDGNNIFNNQRECKNDHIRKSTKIINNKNNDDNISKKNNNKGRISLPIMSRVSIVLQQMFGDEIDVIASNDDKNDGDGGKGGNVGVGKKKGSRRENTRLNGCNHTFVSQDNISCMDDDVVIDDDGDDDDDQDLIVTWRK